MNQSHTEVLVDELPPCDLCRDGTPAAYDAKTRGGPWAYLCESHMTTRGMGVGLGVGQKLVVRS